MKRSGLHMGGVATVVAAGLLAACGGGGGGGGITIQTTPTPTPVVTQTPSAGGDPTLPAISGNGSGYSPYDVATTLKFPVQAGFDGKGRTIAIVGDETPSPADVSAYVSHFKIPSAYPANYIVKNVTGSPQSFDANGVPEATLDVETVIGLAPGASIVFYDTRGDLSTTAFLAAENQALIDNPDAFSISFGGCEDVPVSAATPEPDTSIFAGLNAKGVAVTASAGDSGDDCAGPTSNPFGVNYPASDPSVIGVGGNETLRPTHTLTSQIAWNDGSTGYNGASGGGVSVAYKTLPTYQSGVSGLASGTNRNVPDVAMPAEDSIIWLSGSAQRYGGTSWSAPEVAAMMATLDEYCNGRPPNAVAELYKAYSLSSGADFIDITSGDNHQSGEPVTYAAKPGYDNVTGLGLLEGMPIANTVCASRVWQANVARASAQAMTASYGEAKDTVLPFVARYAPQADRGEQTTADTRVLLVLRNTPTIGGDEQKVISELTSHGFTVTRTFANHALVEVTAPASGVASYFRTSIHNVDTGRFGVKYANAAPITVPAAIAPYVSSVLADNLPARIPLFKKDEGRP